MSQNHPLCGWFFIWIRCCKSLKKQFKVDDIIETINHIAAVRCVVDNIQAPITQGLVQKLHKLLTYGQVSAKVH